MEELSGWSAAYKCTPEVYTTVITSGLKVGSHLFYAQAEMRQASAGLGAPGSAYGTYSGGSGSYKDTLKQLTRARFDEAFKQ